MQKNINKFEWQLLKFSKQLFGFFGNFLATILAFQ